MPLLLLPHNLKAGGSPVYFLAYVRNVVRNFIATRSGNLTGALELQLVDVAEGSSRTVWKLEGKQVRFLDNEKESEKYKKH